MECGDIWNTNGQIQLWCKQHRSYPAKTPFVLSTPQNEAMPSSGMWLCLSNTIWAHECLLGLTRPQEHSRKVPHWAGWLYTSSLVTGEKLHFPWALRETGPIKGNWRPNSTLWACLYHHSEPSGFLSSTEFRYDLGLASHLRKAS